MSRFSAVLLYRPLLAPALFSVSLSAILLQVFSHLLLFVFSILFIYCCYLLYLKQVFSGIEGYSEKLTSMSMQERNEQTESLHSDSFLLLEAL